MYYSEKGQILDERTEGRIREGCMEEVELKVDFIGLEVGGRRKQGILDRKNKNKTCERRMSLVFAWGREWASQPVWGCGERMLRKKISLDRTVSSKSMVWGWVTLGSQCVLWSEGSHDKRCDQIRWWPLLASALNYDRRWEVIPPAPDGRLHQKTPRVP